MMVIDNLFNHGQIVYLKTDKDQLPRIVLRFSVKPNEIVYCLGQGSNESWHMDYEISETVDVLLKTE